MKAFSYGIFILLNGRILKAELQTFAVIISKVYHFQGHRIKMDLDNFQPTEQQLSLISSAKNFADEETRRIYAILSQAVVVPPSGLLPPALVEKAGSCHTANPLLVLNRVFVGSILLDLGERDIRKIFSIYGFIRNVTMQYDAATGKHKGHCFIDFDTPDAAQLCLDQMNGATIAGRSIRVGRPVNYPAEMPKEAAKPLRTRIFISNIHEVIGEDELKAVFSPFGPITAAVIAPDIKTGKSKGYGYIQFQKVQDATSAVHAMNTFSLCGLALRVGKTVIGGDLPMSLKAWKEAAFEKLCKEIPQATLRSIEIINAALLKMKSAQPLISSTIVIYNAVTQSDPALESDITALFAKYGSIVKVKIVEETSSSEDHHSVEIYIEFASVEEAMLARSSMNGKWISGRKAAVLLSKLEN